MVIRIARSKDSTEIAALHAASWRYSYSGVLGDEYLDRRILSERTGVWRDRFRAPHPTQYVVVAEEQDAIVAFACAYGSEHDRWGTKLDNLHISPSQKRKSIGTKLIADVASWSSKNYPGKGIFLWVFEQNLPARHFYEHVGGIVAGDTLRIAPDGTAVKELLYVWKSAEELIGSAKKNAFHLGG
jgi:ribosomal protein S18 acetylase RimI-like enzyme